MANQESCQLFIILPEHEDAEKTSSCIRDFSVMSLEEVTGYIRLIDTMECRGQAEHYQLYYDSKNIDSFLKPVQELPECYPSVELTLRNSLNRFAEDWRPEARQDGDVEYRLFYETVADDSFCEACERKYLSATDSANSTFAIINHKAIDRAPDNAAMTRNGESVDVAVVDGSIEAIEKWLQSNRRPVRVYNWNPKHGENGTGAHKEHKNDTVAILYCSREHASGLLQTALGEDAETGPLYAWDEDFNRYMEFKRESKNTMVFHSFHLEDYDRKISAIKKLLGR